MISIVSVFLGQAFIYLIVGDAQYFISKKIPESEPFVDWWHVVEQRTGLTKDSF